jgi:hypothetical protein
MLVCMPATFLEQLPRVLGALVRSLSRSERIRPTGNMLLCFWAFIYFTMCASMLLPEQFGFRHDCVVP